MPKPAIAGIFDHCGWAIAVTASPAGELLDRRRIALVEEGLPMLPHHSEGQRLPLDQAVALVERVHASALRQARIALDALAGSLPGRVDAIALRICPPIPSATADRILDYQSQTKADGVMYREALATAASARGWQVHWYDTRKVIANASLTLGLPDLDAHFLRIRTAIGPPWTRDHLIAMAAAIAAGASPGEFTSAAARN